MEPVRIHMSVNNVFSSACAIPRKPFPLISSLLISRRFQSIERAATLTNKADFVEHFVVPYDISHFVETLNSISCKKLQLRLPRSFMFLFGSRSLHQTIFYADVCI